MKKVFLLIFLVLCIGLTSCTKVVNIYEDNTENINNPLFDELPEIEKITIYYFEPENIIAQIYNKSEIYEIISMFNNWDMSSDKAVIQDTECGIVVNFDDILTIRCAEPSDGTEYYYGFIECTGGKSCGAYYLPLEFKSFIKRLNRGDD